MCARIQWNGVTVAPGARITVETAEGQLELSWGGNKMPPFARAESLHTKWLSRGWQPCRIPATSYAERDGRTKQLVWAPQAGPYAIQGVWKDGAVAVVTRAANERELEVFGHPRHPELLKGPAV
jgi:hypothetical protein